MLDNPAAAAGLLAAAGCLAEMAGGARINVLAPRVPPASTILATEEVLTRDRQARLRAQELARVSALKASFDAWSMTAPHAEWMDMEAIAHELIVKWGRQADLVVLERPGQRDYGATWQALPAALFETDRPLVLVPPNPTVPFGRRIAIAWRDDPHATRAVLSALRTITQATAVHLLAGVRRGAPQPRMPEILLEHGITADIQVIPIGDQPFALALLERAHALGADMLVMGAYAHSPWRNLLLGGVTRWIIAHTDLPVLMRH
jgi:nucleotide-binding universal stress UspA family protein